MRPGGRQRRLLTREEDHADPINAAGLTDQEQHEVAASKLGIRLAGRLCWIVGQEQESPRSVRRTQVFVWRRYAAKQ